MSTTNNNTTKAMVSRRGTNQQSYSDNTIPSDNFKIRQLAAKLGISLPNPLDKFITDPEDLDMTQKNALKIHADDLLTMLREQQKGLKRSGRLRALQRAKESPTGAIITAATSAIFGLFWAVFSNPLAPLTEPIPWMYSIVALTFLTWGLFFVNFLLYLFEMVGGYSLVHWVSHSYGEGLSLINLGHPHIYNPEDVKYPIDVIVSAQVSLGGLFHSVDSDEHRKRGCEEDDSKQSHIDGQRTVYLDLDVAKFLLMLSSLVYERKEIMVSEAASFPRWSVERLFDAEKLIHEKAFHLGLRFIAVSDFTDVAGSYCGVFYSVGKHPFIVVTMKGTTPSNIHEFLVDSNFAHTTAESHLFGACHRGFYSALFPPQAAGTRINPYRRITQTLRKIAHDIVKKHKHEKTSNLAQVPLYVTGHSLGAALAGVLYTRFLMNTSDLGNKIKLRDCFTYGQPRFGNSDFVSGFEKLLHMDEHADKNLWRFCNESDIVCNVPPGLADNEDRRMNLTPVSLLNYGHIGTAVHLEASSPLAFRIDPVGVRIGDQIEIVESGLAVMHSEYGCVISDFDFKSPITPVTIASFAMKMCTPFMRDHFTSRYLFNMDRIKGARRIRHINDQEPQAVMEKIAGYLKHGNRRGSLTISDSSAHSQSDLVKGNKHGNGHGAHQDEVKAA